MRVWKTTFVACIAVGCATPRSATNVSTQGRPQSAPIEATAVACTDPLAEGDAWLSDGMVGVRIGRNGLAKGLAYVANQYEPTGEERLLPQPNVLDLSLKIDGASIRPILDQGYLQRFEFASQKLITTYACGLGMVETETSLKPYARQVWTIRATASATLEVGTSSMGSIELRANGHDAKSPLVVRSGDEVRLTLLAAMPSEIVDRPTGPEASIEIDGPIKDQQAVNSFIAYLKMAIPDAGQVVAVSPMALSSELYRGHVFWDADVWVFPALMLLDPTRAKVIPDYRLAMLEGALSNYGTWIWERQAMLKAGGGGAKGATPLIGAAKYPWESAVSGKETMIGQFRQALHQNGAVLWGLNQAQQLGLADPSKVDVVRLALQRFWQSVSELRPDGRLGIRQVFGVDEFKLTDNDLITNLLADWTLSGMRYTSKPAYFLPERDGVFLSYEGDQQLSYKQATAVLSLYPYQYPPAEGRARQMMGYYASKANPLGPAMTEAIHATIYARLHEPDRAYAEWKKAWGDFTKDRPLLLFSEHRKRDRTYFVTGAAGCLQTVLYGFLGIRIDYSPEPGAKWSTQLRKGGWLSIKPHLPKEWKRVTLKNFMVLGRRYTATITPDSVQVKQGDP